MFSTSQAFLEVRIVYRTANAKDEIEIQSLNVDLCGKWVRVW